MAPPKPTPPPHPPSVSPEDMDRLRNAIVNKQPFISGTLPQPPNAFALYFGKDRNACRIDLSSATADDLRALSDACNPASFGRGSEDVLDETYRKAGKLDRDFFSTPFVPQTTKLIDLIRGELLEGTDSTRPISAELYKLNVYGEGSFFKAHQDTPRSGTMFGTLVVVYPTPHTGGALILRHHGEEWTFDSAAAVASQASPAFGYIAVFSDVKHEVSVVESGHRVTLTYNLYYDDIPAAETTALHALPAPAPVSNQALLESVLRSLLEDPAFMPSGGHLGFGLRHVYPVKEEDTFDAIYGLLKGSDAVVDRVARTLSLRPRLYLVYEDEWTDDWDDGTFGRLPGSDASGKNAWNEYEVLVLIPEVPSEGSCQEGSPTSFNVECYEDLIFVRPPTAARYRPENDVHWVTPYKSVTGHTMVNAVYGNEVQLDHQYADLCLVVPIGKPGERSVPPQTEKAEISRFLEE